MVQMLLNAGADAELLNQYNQTAINIAVSEKKTEVVKLLVDRKVNIHNRNKFGWSPIMNATEKNADAEIVRILAEGGANLADTHLPSGYTPLHFAMTQKAEVTKVLLEFRKIVDLEKRTITGEAPLLITAWSGSVEHMKLLIRAGADVNAQNERGWTALSTAASNFAPPEAIDLLLSQPDIKIDTIGKFRGTALMVACCSMSHKKVMKLLACGADPNISIKDSSDYSTALMAACMPWGRSYSENMDKVNGIICELVANGTDVSAMGGRSIYNAICAASFYAGVSTINLLLDNGASAQRPDPLGRLPIHFAAANGVKNFEAMALVHRGDVMVCDCAGKNDLHWAAQFGRLKTIEAILARVGSSVRDMKQYINQADIEGWTPLCWATRPFIGELGSNIASEPCAYLKTLRYLVDQGADRSVKLNMGTGENVETFTLVQMAKLCDAENGIISLLDINVDSRWKNGTADKSSEANEPIKIYKSDATVFCDICLNVR